MHPMNPVEQYASRVQETLRRVLDSQLENIQSAARVVSDVARRDGIVYTFGSGHSQLVAIEFCQRAGGLVCFDLINDRTFGKAERLEGYARALLDNYPISTNDALIVISNSGCNPLPVEMVGIAKERGVTTIAITSLGHSHSVASRHSSGKKVFELADIVIDNCGVPGDGVVMLPGIPDRAVGPTSTLAGVFIANCVTVMAVAYCLAAGFTPGVLMSANLANGDATNRVLMEFIRARTKGW